MNSSPIITRSQTAANKDAVQKDDKALANLAYEVLSLEDCVKLARTQFGMDERALENIKLDYVRHCSRDDKSIAILHAWKEQKGPNATAKVLANHIGRLGLSAEKLRNIKQILNVQTPEKAFKSSPNETITFSVGVVNQREGKKRRLHVTDEEDDVKRKRSVKEKAFKSSPNEATTSSVGVVNQTEGNKRRLHGTDEEDNVKSKHSVKDRQPLLIEKSGKGKSASGNTKWNRKYRKVYPDV